MRPRYILLALIALALVAVPTAAASAGINGQGIMYAADSGGFQVIARGVTATISVPDLSSSTSGQLIDNFNRPNENPLAGGWQQASTTIWAPLQLVNNTATNAPSGSSMSYYTGYQFTGTDGAAVYGTYGGIMNCGGNRATVMMLQNPGGANSASGYEFGVESSGGANNLSWILSRFDAGVGRVNIASAGGVDTNLSHIKLVRTGNLVQGWASSDGQNWTKILEATDSTYTTGTYYPAVHLYACGVTMDDVGVETTTSIVGLMPGNIVSSFARIDSYPAVQNHLEVGWIKSEGNTNADFDNCMPAGHTYEGIFMEVSQGGALTCQYMPTPSGYTWGQPVQMQIQYLGKKYGNSHTDGDWRLTFDSQSLNGVSWSVNDTNWTTGFPEVTSEFNAVGGGPLGADVPPCNYETDFSNLSYQPDRSGYKTTDPYVVAFNSRFTSTNLDWPFTGYFIPYQGGNDGGIIFHDPYC